MNESLEPGDRLEITATAVECVDDSTYPFVLLVRFVDADGRQHDMTAKDVDFGGAFRVDTKYPCPTTVPCEVIEAADGVALVRLTWNETDEGLWEVRVPASALVSP